MACTNDDALAERMRIMSLHGISKDAWKRFTAEGSWYYEIVAPGFKYNLTDIAAALGLQQLKKADQFRAERERVARQYGEQLAQIPEVIVPTASEDRIHSWHLYAIRLQLEQLKIDRAEVIRLLKEAGIGTSVHWIPLHMHPYYRETYSFLPEDFPVSARLSRELVSLPIYPGLREEEIGYVAQQLKEVLRLHRR